MGVQCKSEITCCHVQYTCRHSKAAPCVALRANGGAIPPSSRPAEPALRGSRRSREIIRGLLAVAALSVGAGACEIRRVDDEGAGGGAPSREESAAPGEAGGWKLLSDGTLDAWRGYGRDNAPSGWSASGDTIAFAPGVEGGTLITRERFGDFELAFAWRISEGGNSGVFYRVTETEAAPYWSGPEYQILDNAGHSDGGASETSAGANFALHGPGEDHSRPVGEWNHSRIFVQGELVEHWLNGALIVAYELRSDEWRAAVAASKFADWPAYGMAAAGHLGLQDHGDAVWYRDVRVRER